MFLIILGYFIAVHSLSPLFSSSPCGINSTSTNSECGFINFISSFIKYRPNYRLTIPNPSIPESELLISFVSIFSLSSVHPPSPSLSSSPCGINSTSTNSECGFTNSIPPFIKYRPNYRSTIPNPSIPESELLIPFVFIFPSSPVHPSPATSTSFPLPLPDPHHQAEKAIGLNVFKGVFRFPCKVGLV